MTTTVDIKLLEEAYITIQSFVQRDINNGSCESAVKTDPIRALLRNAITSATNEDSQRYQERIESASRFVASLAG